MFKKNLFLIEVRSWPRSSCATWHQFDIGRLGSWRRRLGVHHRQLYLGDARQRLVCVEWRPGCFGSIGQRICLYHHRQCYRNWARLYMAFEVVDRSKYQSLQRESSHRQCIRIRSKLLGLVEFNFNGKNSSSKYRHTYNFLKTLLSSNF